MPVIKDVITEDQLVNYLFWRLYYEAGWRDLGTFVRVVVARKRDTFLVTPEMYPQLEEEFFEENYTNAVSFAVARHRLIQDPKGQIYGIARVIGSHVTVPTLIDMGLLDENGQDIKGEGKVNAIVGWIELGTSLISQYGNNYGYPLWYLYMLDNYVGPKYKITGGNHDYAHLVVEGSKTIGEPMPEYDPNEVIILVSHREVTDKDYIRMALDLEHFSKVEEEYGTFYHHARQSPIVPIKLRDTREFGKLKEAVYKDGYWYWADKHTNWWQDSLIDLEGYFDEESMFVIIRADRTPYYQHPHEVPSIPLFFGRFELAPKREEPPEDEEQNGEDFNVEEPNGKEVDEEEWNGNVAIFAGTIGDRAEEEYISHSYDYIVMLKWEDETDADLDLHAYINYDKNLGVHYINKTIENDELKVWLDFDYIGHRGRTREDHPEIITIEKKKSDISSIISIQVENYNGGQLSEDVTITVKAVNGEFEEEIVIPYSDLSGAVKCIYVADIELSTGELTLKMEELPTPWGFEWKVG